MPAPLSPTENPARPPKVVSGAPVEAERENWGAKGSVPVEGPTVVAVVAVVNEATSNLATHHPRSAWHSLSA